MRVEEVRDFDELAQVDSDKWRQIADSSTVATIFQTWEWTSTWWRHFGKGKRLWALRFVENGETVGYCALFFPARPMLVRTARFVGTGVSDYLDLIAAPGREGAVAEAFRAYLAENRGRWDWIDLRQVRPDSAAERLVGAAEAVQVAPWQKGTCMYLPLAPSWPTFQKSLTKMMRENIKRYTRQVEKQHGEFRLANAETLRGDLDQLFELHTRRWNGEGAPGMLHTAAIRDFHQDVARALLTAGMLRLHVLSLDGRPRSIIYNFQKRAVCYYYLSGFDPSLSKLSLGLVMLGHAMRHAIEADHAEEFDLMCGDEPYKSRWSAQVRLTRRLSMTHPGMRSAAPAHAVQMMEELLFQGIRRAGIRPRRLAHRLRTSISPTAWFGRRPLGPQTEEAAVDRATWKTGPEAT